MAQEAPVVPEDLGEAPVVPEDDEEEDVGEAPVVPADVRALLVEVGHVLGGRLDYDERGARDLKFLGSREGLLLLLQTQLSKLVTLHPPTNLTNHVPHRVDSIQKDFTNFKRTLRFLGYFPPTFVFIKGWGTKITDTMFTHKQCDFYKDHIQLKLENFSTDSHRKQEMEHANEVSDEIDELLEFLHNPIGLDTMMGRLEDAAGSMSELLTYEFIQSTPLEEPMEPLVKLWRLLIQKISRKTSNAHTLLWKIPAVQFIDLERSLLSGLESIRELCDSMYALYSWNDRATYDNELRELLQKIAHRHIGNTIYWFEEFSSILKKSLASCPPDKDQDFIKAFENWLRVWFDRSVQAAREVRFYVDAVGPEFES